jgi:aryl-alcohol dehydrogenase-like predicted oxidoreductase
MEYVTLGRTGLRVSVAGLGCGGFSRLGLGTGRTEAEAVRLVRTALDLGINLIDTAANYGTESVVGEAIRSTPRDRVVIATKAAIDDRKGHLLDASQVVESLDASLRRLGVDYIDIFQLHGVRPRDYDHALQAVVPALLRERDKGKFRYLGLTESSAEDHEHHVFNRAFQDDVWDTGMVAFHMMHQNARDTVLPRTQTAGIGTLLMFAVRNIFAKPERLRQALDQLAAEGKLPRDFVDSPDPLGFLIHAGGAANITEAAYRFVRHEPGVDVVLTGTGDPGHLRANVDALLKPPLPESDRQRIDALFGGLVGVGLDRPQARPGRG